MEAGIDDVGIGALFGLHDWNFEMLAVQQHIRHLEEGIGVGPHTISVPRIEPAVGSATASRPPHAVSDADFKKIVAILRLAVPYTGLIMSTRENADTRRATFALGVPPEPAGQPGEPTRRRDPSLSGRLSEQLRQRRPPPDKMIVAHVANYPVVVTEFGDEVGSAPASYTEQMTAWLDLHGYSVTAWTWNPWGGSNTLIQNASSYTPTVGFGQTYHDWAFNHQ